MASDLEQKYVVRLIGCALEVPREEFYSAIKHYRKDWKALWAMYQDAEQIYATLEATLVGVGRLAYVEAMYGGGRAIASDKRAFQAPRRIEISGNIMRD